MELNDEEAQDLPGFVLAQKTISGRSETRRVRLGGTVQRVPTGTDLRADGFGTTIATLPTGYLPPASVMFIGATSPGEGNDGSCDITITSGGAIKVRASGTDFSRVSLDGISFLTLEP